MKWQKMVVDPDRYLQGMKAMMDAIKIPVVQGVEVGLGWGVSGKYFLDRFREARLVSFDTNEGLEAVERMKSAYGRRHVFINPEWMKNDWETVNTPFPGLKCEWLYIDGGHKYEEVKEDLRRYERYLLPGGVIAFDDYNTETSQWKYPGVKKAVCEFMEQNKERYSPLTVPNGKFDTGPVFAIKIKD